MELRVSRKDIDAFLSAAYLLDADGAAQVRALRDAFAGLPIAAEHTMAFAWHADAKGDVAVDHLSTFAPEVDAAFWQVKAAASREYSLSMLRAQPMFGEGDDHYSRTRAYGRARRLGLPGFCGMLCPTRTGHAVTVGTPLLEARGGIRSRVLDQLAAHVAAAWRLRMRLATPDAFEESAEATFHPSGRLEDALGPAKSGDVRQRLRSLVLAREKALRGKEERLWPALLGGRYTIVDLFESSGARYVVAHRNPATAADLSRLDDRERQVVEGVAAGKLEKVLAIDLGVSESHLSKILHCALRRLGLSSAIDLTLIASCSDAVPLDDEVLGGSIVAAFRLRGPTADALLGLTPAERAITSDILRGLSNREIAARRNRSQRTIANQVVSVLEKMRVPTRRALVASLTRA